MIKVDVLELKTKKIVGSLELPREIFGQKVNEPLVLQVIKAQLAGLRQGTASTRTKGKVRGGGRKPFRQKGTGNARQGSLRSPLQPGGGSTFGPQPRDYRQSTPKKMVRGALKSVLSDKLASQRLIVIDKLNLSSHKTKDLGAVLTKIFAASKVLLVDDLKDNNNMVRASRNLPAVRYMNVENINVYDLVKHEWLFLSKEAADAIIRKLA